MTVTSRIRRRTAFTLIELLVVVSIITVMMSLLMAGVQRARDAGKRTENNDRMSQVGAAVGVAKQKVNMPYVWSGPFTLKSRYAGNEPELDILLTMFPQMMTQVNPVPGLPANDPNQTNGYSGPDVVLDSNQALVLLLTGGAPTNMTGFSTDPRRPFSAAGSSRKGPFLEANPKWFTTGPVPPIGVTLTGDPNHPWLIDPYNVPYAVFAATKGKNGSYAITNNGSPQKFPVIINSVNVYDVVPYQTSTGFVNSTGFQIISAGKDKAFGAGGGNLPATNQLPNGDGGEDDQANFSRATLGSGIQ